MTLTKEISSVNCKYFLKKIQTNSSLQNLRTEFRIMMSKERLNALLLVSIHEDIFLDYGKMIDIPASKYPRRMFLINSLSGN